MSNAVLNDPSLQAYYEALFAMYATPGWRVLMEDFGRMLETNNILAGIDTPEQLWFRKGELSLMLLIKNHQDAHERAYASLVAEQEGGPEETTTGGRATVVS